MWGIIKVLFRVTVLILLWKSLCSLNPIPKKDKIKLYLEVLETNGVLFPRVALAQNILETGVFNSKIYRQNHNMFGMKESSRRFDIGSKNGHANYPHESHVGDCTIQCYIPSIKDYAAWQRVFKVDQRCFTETQYIYYLQHLPGKRKYAEDPNYESKILFILNSL